MVNSSLVEKAVAYLKKVGKIVEKILLSIFFLEWYKEY